MTFMEINLLNKLIEKRPNIDLIIIDGSIVIMPINLLFTQDIEIAKKYDRLFLRRLPWIRKSHAVLTRPG